MVENKKRNLGNVTVYYAIFVRIIKIKFEYGKQQIRIK